jgi:filamentous hemagglutinin
MTSSCKPKSYTFYTKATWRRKLVAWSMLFLYLIQPLAASAQVVADPKAPGDKTPQVQTAANGLPVVQIAAPSAAGVSHNQYQQFNVDPSGLILNNSQVLTQTQLAGYITGNPNLANGSARIILNEVTSNNPSYLRGYTEVAGQKAEVIVANPNGIYGDGFGFINTSRAVLTTGTPVFGGSGSLDSFHVTGGQISIQGAGMNASDVDQVDLISRSVAVNAGIWAKNLNVVAGSNQVDYDTLNTQTIAGDANQPTVAIDVAALGGMYANKIMLVGTENGVGVNSQGTIVAQAGDVTITSAGKVLLSGDTSATGNIQVAAGDDVTNQNTLYAQGNTNVTTQGVLENDGIIAAGQHTILHAHSITSTGTLGAGVQTDGTLGTTGDLSLNANGTISAQGKNLAAGNLTINGTGINLVNSQTYAGGNANLTTTAGDLDNTGAVLQANGALNVSASGTVRNDKNTGGTAGQITGSSVTITANDISNKGGMIQQTGAAATTLTAGDTIDNTGGNIASNGATTLNVGNLINQGGTIQASGVASVDLSVIASGDIDNSARNNGQAGIIAASGNTTVAASSLNNTQGQLTAGQELNVGTTQGIVNTKGLLAANQNVNVSGARIDNTQGTIGSVRGQTGVNAITGLLDNTAGRIEAEQVVNISAVGLNNTDGVIVGDSLSANSNTQILDNTRGKFVANGGAVNIQSGSFNNEAGLIQAKGALTINTHGQTFGNTNSGATGGIVGQDDINLVTGDLNNQAGYISSGSSLATHSATINNTQGGVVTSVATMDIDANALNNQGGQIQALGNVSINLSGALTNTGSLVRSSQNLSVNADTITNTNTQGDNQGMEGQSVSLTSSKIDNGQGTIRANDALNLTGSGRIGNSQGLISSGQTLTLQDMNLASKTLVITNTGGTLIAGQQLNIDSAGLSGDGNVLSQGDLGIKLSQDYTNTGELQATGSAKLETTGNITNQATLLAGSNLNINASNIDNTASGEISAQNTTVTATGTLTNRGLIDGGEALVKADTLTNLGTGRIYGGHLAIQSNTLNNDAENGVAPVIAARGRLDIGAQTIVNQEHALILSAGDMAIGGSLDTNKQATGQATTLNNSSATIEALGNLNLSAQQINNTNAHFSTNVETTNTEYNVVEYQGSGSPNRYTPDTPDVYIYYDESAHLHTPEGNFESWTEYNYTRTTTETKVQSSDPAQIQSGAAMQINANTLTNDKSSIIAGSTLSGSIGSLNNIEVPGERTITDTGTVTSYWRNHRSGTDNTGSSTSDYNPPATIQEITLNPTVYQQNTATVGTGTQVASLSSSNINQVPSSANAAVVTSNGGAVISPITQVTTLAGGIVRSGGVNTSVPNNSLFSVTPNSNAHYLVETDPRFADYQNWVSSDYMLKALNLDPSLVQKRLGDGFYEQQLISEQVTQLTGQRFLDGYSSDQTEYMALMNNGTTFAQEHQLTVGVALTADQMAQLTSDIVWLVKKDVTLPNGEVTQALVPELYVHSAQSGDLSASGALIAGNNVQLNLSGDLTNSGTITARKTVDITAENIQNIGGRINGNDVSLQTRTDLNNLGGQIQAVNSLSATAGRDLNVVSTTSTQANAQGSLTNVDRVAGLYVTGDKGTLLTSAGRDTNLIAAQISNSGEGGNTTITAGNNLNLGTVTEGSSNHIVWNSSNQRSDSSSSDVGTTIQTQGNISLQAGNDLNAKAASVDSSQGAILVTAGHDVNLTAGETDTSVDEAHQHKEHGLLSSKTITTRDTLNETTVQATTFSGDTITVKANQDINVKGSNIVATNDVNLAAQGNVSITAAQETDQEEHMRQEKTSGLFGGGGLGFTIGSKSEKTTNDDQTVNQVGSTVGSIDGNVSITAGDKVNSVGTTFVTGKDLNITGKDVTIDNTVNTVDSQTKYEFKQSGLSVSLGGSAVAAATSTAADIRRSGEVEDGRLEALYDYKAVQDIKPLAKNGLQGGVSVSVSIGSSQTTSEQTSHTETVNASNINASGNVNVTATDGDVNLKGTNVNATNVTLDATKNINIDGADNKEQTTSNTSSSSWSVGGTIGTGFFGNVNSGSGKENENATTNTGSVINASDTLTLKSGNDTNITGSQVSGDKVVATIGGDLNIASKQDTDNYTANNQSSGFEVSTGQTGPKDDKKTIGGLTGSVSTGKTDSTYASVTDQAGIFAGKDGFDITVGKNTDLKGAVISSDATPDKNKISTGTLTYSDIQNKADYNSSSVGVNLNTNPNAKLNQQGLTPNIGVTATGSSNSTTQSAISPGTITITGNQTQDLSGLSRDPSSSLNALEKIFDKKTVAEQQELANLFGQEAFKAIGDLKLKEGSPEKVALDTFVGGLMAQLGGGSFASGAAGAGFNQIVMNELSKIKDPAILQWASALVGTVAAKLVGGNAQTGASTSTSETKNNYLSHWQLGEKERQLAACTTEEDKENVEKYWNSVDTVQNAIMSGIGYTPQMLEDNDNLMQEVASRAQEILSDPNATPGDYDGFKITPTGGVLVLIGAAYVALNIDLKTLTLGMPAIAGGMNNLRVLRETTIKGYDVSMDLERGGSGLTNIHLLVDDVKYFFDEASGTFLNAAGNRLPNSLRGNQQIMDALKKAQDRIAQGW